MATVRTTAPRHETTDADAKSKKKRKRSAVKTKTRAQGALLSSVTAAATTSNSSSSSASPHFGAGGGNSNSNDFVDDMVRRKLDAHSKWQLCTQKIRRELERVEQIADNAVMQVQDEAADFRSVQEQVEKQAKATVQYVETIQRDVEKASTAIQNEMQNMKKKLRNIDQRVQQQATQSIDEDFLMTQLTELQERYETELNKHKEEYISKFQDKQQALDAVGTQIHQISQASRQEREGANRAAAALDASFKSLKHHMHELERERQASTDIHTRLKIDIDELSHRFSGFDRKLDDIALKQQQQQQQTPVQYPPHLAHPFPIEDPATKEEIHLLSRDVHLISEDVRRLTLRFDARLEEVHQDFGNQLRDLRSELFAALDHDSRQHVVENKRVRDMIFDLEGSFRDGMGRMEERMRRMDENARRVEESLRRIAMERRSRSPPRRPAGAYQPRDIQPYEARPMSGEFPPRVVPPSFVGPIVAPRRSRSHSRSNPRDQIQRPSASRSPHRSVQHRTESASRQESTISAHASHSPEPDRRQSSLQQTSQIANAVQSSDDQMAEVCDSVPSIRVSEREQNSEEREQVARTQEQPLHHRPQPPIRCSKKPRKSHEVIVIEDDDSADEMVVPPYRAPPDVVTEDGDTRPRTVVVREQGVGSPANSDSDSFGSSDRLQKLSDIRLGSLLYFCFGGAPSLDLEWTRYFSKLGSGDCIEMSRATNFLHRYPGLHSFPIYLAQFIVQAIIVEAPAGGTQSVGLGFGFDDDTPVDNVDPELVKHQFHKVLDKIRRSWAETLVMKLQKMVDLTQDGNSADSDARLSVNPALDETAGGGAQFSICSWLHQQAKFMWFLLRRHRFGSKMPAFTGDMVASPGVYVFLLMFDPVQVNRVTPQSAAFRLTNWGRALAIQLWDHLLSKLPYLLFADCSWLENQTDSSGKLPPLGFCHMLSAILAWNSITDKMLESSADFYSEMVRLFLNCLHVNGVRVRDSGYLVSLTMNDAVGAAAEIELIGVDTEMVSLLQLDGFFEVAHAINSSQAAPFASALATPGNRMQITNAD